MAIGLRLQKKKKKTCGVQSVWNKMAKNVLSKDTGPPGSKWGGELTLYLKDIIIFIYFILLYNYAHIIT